MNSALACSILGAMLLAAPAPGAARALGSLQDPDVFSDREAREDLDRLHRGRFSEGHRDHWERSLARQAQAVERGVAWLTSQQAEDGALRDEADRAGVLSTSTALLAWLADGSTTQVGPHQQAVRSALRWLVEQQSAEGAFLAGPDPDGRIHALATFALVDAAYDGRHPALWVSAASAVAWLAKQPGDDPWKAAALAYAARAGFEVGVPPTSSAPDADDAGAKAGQLLAMHLAPRGPKSRSLPRPEDEVRPVAALVAPATDPALAALAAQGIQQNAGESFDALLVELHGWPADQLPDGSWPAFDDETMGPIATTGFRLFALQVPLRFTRSFR